MSDTIGVEGFTDAGWAVWEPLTEAVRPRGKTPPKELRRTMSAIFWRHQNGAKWRAVPPELGPWWLAAQLFIRWAKQGIWDQLLERAQERAADLQMSLVFLDGTSIRAHAKAAGAPKKGDLARAETSVKRLVALGAGSAPRP